MSIEQFGYQEYADTGSSVTDLGDAETDALITDDGDTMHEPTGQDADALADSPLLAGGIGQDELLTALRTDVEASAAKLHADMERSLAELRTDSERSLARLRVSSAAAVEELRYLIGDDEEDMAGIESSEECVTVEAGTTFQSSVADIERYLALQEVHDVEIVDDPANALSDAEY